jgi:4-carboxymuconolactone decarboxylase
MRIPLRFVLLLIFGTALRVLAQAQAPAAGAASGDLNLRGDRFKPLTASDLNAEQKAFVDEVLKAPNPTLAGPYNMLLRSPELGRAAHEFGAYPRFRSSVPTKLNELAIMMAVRQWNSEFVWFAHRRAAQQAGLSPAVGDAIAAGRRPANMQPDEEAVYNFCDELLNSKQVSDAAFNALKDRIGERGIVDLIAGMGYFQFVAMLLNTDRYPLPPNVKPELTPAR